MKTLTKILVGSHLYGTNNKDSDKDYKGIFLPSFKEIATNKVPRVYDESTNKKATKNSSNDVDSHMYSLHHYLDLCYKGDAGAIEMLFAPKSNIVQTSLLWKQIVANRNKLISRNMTGMVGFAKSQAIRYSAKGDKINILSSIIRLLNDTDKELFGDVIDKLPESKYVEIKYNRTPDIEKYYLEETLWRDYNSFVVICDKQFQGTVKVQYVKKSLQKLLDRYGNRANEAADNGGIDWKSISHSIRVAEEVRILLQYGEIYFPCVSVSGIRNIKEGKRDLKECMDYLEDELETIKNLQEKSNLREKPDRNFFDNLLVSTYEDRVLF
jgi:hypothetical protein